jgi:hypothetical protein
VENVKAKAADERMSENEMKRTGRKKNNYKKNSLSARLRLNTFLTSWG